MKTITLKQAVELLESATAIILPDENGLVVYPSIDFQDNEDNIFLTVKWEEEYEIYELYCLESDNKNAKVDNNFLYLTTMDGDELKIQLLQPITNLLDLI